MKKLRNIIVESRKRVLKFISSFVYLSLDDLAELFCNKYFEVLASLYVKIIERIEALKVGF
jgi:hypothetical protein